MDVFAPFRGPTLNVANLGPITTATINAAITTVSSAGGGVVDIPGGATIGLDKVAGQSYAVNLKSNVILRAYGASLRLNNAQDAHMVAATDVSNCGVFGGTWDGNLANQTNTVHGIRIEGTSRFIARDASITSARIYGISLAAGTNNLILFDNLFITDTGHDGVDMHNPNNSNAQVTVRDCIIQRFDRLASGQKAGIDVRCVGGLVEGCLVQEFGDLGSGNVGIRVREGEIASVNGLGGHESRVVGCRVEAGNTDTHGYYLGGRYVTLADSYAVRCGVGVSVLQRGSTLDGVTVIGSKTRGVELLAPAPTTDITTVADRCTISGTQVIIDDGAGPAFMVRTDNNRIVGCRQQGKSEAATAGLQFPVGADNNRFQVDSFEWSSALSDAGSGNTGTTS